MSGSRFIGFRVPATAIAALVPDVHDRIARPIRRDADGLWLLLRYAEALRDGSALATAEARRLAVTHVHDLMALVLGASGDAAEVAKLRGGRAARLHATKAEILDNLDPDLSVGAVAARHRLPVRYVQRLFEAEGTTFTDFVLSRRLARVHRLLGDPRFAARPIATIAAEAGFGDLTHFNRMFRRRYGATPSDVRAAGRESR